MKAKCPSCGKKRQLYYKYTWMYLAESVKDGFRTPKLPGVTGQVHMVCEPIKRHSICKPCFVELVSNAYSRHLEKVER